jgi:hypothetical protein
MWKRKHQTASKSTGGVEHLSFTLEEILSDIGVTNFEHTSADGCCVYRRTHRLQPLSPVKNSDDSMNFPFQEDLSESLDAAESSLFGGQGDLDPVEFETPRAKRYLSSVCNCRVVLFDIVIY